MKKTLFAVQQPSSNKQTSTRDKTLLPPCCEEKKSAKMNFVSLRNTLSSSSLWPSSLLILLTTLSVWLPVTHGGIEKLLSIRTCGKPNIQNIMNNVTAKPGQSATFKCQVDMSCIVAYIEWYHEMDNGTEKLIKTASSSGDPHVHVIKEVKPTDEGLYTCIAGNFIGQATASAYLEVNAANVRTPGQPIVIFLLLMIVSHLSSYTFR